MSPEEIADEVLDWERDTFFTRPLGERFEELREGKTLTQLEDDAALFDMVFKEMLETLSLSPRLLYYIEKAPHCWRSTLSF
jgi:hypothetical protein